MLAALRSWWILLVVAYTAPALAQPACTESPRWHVPSKGQALEHRDAIAALAGSRVILLGEHHDNADHHRWQLHTAAALIARQPDVALGFEMFPRRAQPVLDRWVNGELSEDEFLKEAEWNENWSFDAAYYLPLFHLARLHAIPMLALNVDRALFNRVTRDGWDGVPEAERAGIADPAPPAKDYLRYLAGSFLRHNPADAPGQGVVDPAQGQRFLRFVQGQQLWDAAMAQAIAARVRDGKRSVIAFMGSGHMAWGYGVPHQLRHLGVQNVAVAIPWDRHFECAQLTPAFADLVFGVSK